MNIYDFARSHLSPYKTKGSEIIPHKCPYCHGGKHGDKETFALNIDKKTFNCKRGSCGKDGNFYQLCQDFGEKADMENMEMYKKEKKYKKPQTSIKPITSEAEQYLSLRKISKKTMDLLGVSSDDKGNIVFPYYQNQELIFVKFRPAKKSIKGEKKSWREAETKPILWGMDLCDTQKPLIITEGEIDTLSLYEAGLTNIVSVPSGAEDFTWLETCWEWVQQFNKVIICGDDDSAGREMVTKIVKKLGSFRCYITELERKDANEVLFYDGKEPLINAIKNAKDVPIHGLIDLSDVEPIDPRTIKTIKTGIKAIDEATGGMRYGELSVWTGRRGEGKSTLLSMLMVEAVQNNNKICCYSGELKASDLQYWVNLQAAGKKHIKKHYNTEINKDIFYLEDEDTQKIRKWYKGKFFLYDNSISGSTEEESILKIFEYAAKKYDCKLFIVDNLMTAKYESSNEKDYYLRQIQFVRDLVNFANYYNVHIHLVAHPKKQKGEIENDDISGRAEITNLAHNVFAVERIDRENNTGKVPDCDVMINVLKNRWEGIRAKAGLNYCPVSRRLYMPSVGAMKPYGWEDIEIQKAEIQEECPF